LRFRFSFLAADFLAADLLLWALRHPWRSTTKISADLRRNARSLRFTLLNQDKASLPSNAAAAGFSPTHAPPCVFPLHTEAGRLLRPGVDENPLDAAESLE
jgi:hypothetical protein